MYLNTSYLNHSHMDFKDKSLPLIVGSCGTYTVFPDIQSYDTIKGTSGLSDYLSLLVWAFSF